MAVGPAGGNPEGAEVVEGDSRYVANVIGRARRGFLDALGRNPIFSDQRVPAGTSQ